MPTRKGIDARASLRILSVPVSILVIAICGPLLCSFYNYKRNHREYPRLHPRIRHTGDSDEMREAGMRKWCAVEVTVGTSVQRMGNTGNTMPPPPRRI